MYGQRSKLQRGLPLNPLTQVRSTRNHQVKLEKLVVVLDPEKSWSL